MDGCLTNWNTEIDVELPLPSQRKPLGLDNELMELLWQNGDVVLQSQTCRKPNFDPTCKSKQDQKHGMLISRVDENPNTSTEDHEPVSWINCPIDQLFEKDFYADFLSEIPSSDLNEPDKPSGKSDSEKAFRFSSPEVCAPTSLLLPRYGSSEAFVQNQSLEGNKTVNLQFPFARQVVSNAEHGFVQESSVMTIRSSHCASNQVAKEMDMRWASSSGVGGRKRPAELEDNYAMKVRTQNSSMERETSGPANTSSEGSASSCQKTSSQSNGRYRNKRKNMDVGEYECPIDATELESAAGNNKSSRKSGTTRRSRVAEVHNLSERKRRDRINERMRALQELIPHSHKSDKASMLDEAIEYMKSLQLQLQLWMGRAMVPMMHPGMQPHIYYAGMGIRPPTVPAIQNLMGLSRMPLVDQGTTVASTSNQAPAGHGPVLRPVNYQNQMQNASFPEQQYTQTMGLHFVPDASQTINTFNFSSHSTEQNQVVAPPGNGSS